MKKIFLAISLALCAVLAFSSCSRAVETNFNIDQPDYSATEDQIYPAKNPDAVEISPNVNGMRFNMTLDVFTERYNSYKRVNGDTDLIIRGNWYKQGGETTDYKGTKIQYYYYDDNDVNLTATVEAESGKLMNVGLGTTTSKFMGQTESGDNSDKILKKAALVAMVACQYPASSLDLLESIFYSITVDSNDSLWYEGFVFTLSTDKKESDSKKRTMLFRVFPVADEIRSEWKIEEYQI